jgi:hypothetical protein
MATGEEIGGKFSWKLPLIAALVVLCTAGPLLWSRDFGLFLLMPLYPMALGCVCFLVFGAGLFAKKPGARPTLLVTALTAAATFAALFFTAGPATTDFMHDRLGFWVWYVAHRDVTRQYAKRDAIIMTWDSWGFAGMGNDSFLVSDPDDSIGSSTENADRWTKRMKSDCDVVGSVRLKRGLYILTTYNCPLTDERKSTN